MEKQKISKILTKYNISNNIVKLPILYRAFVLNDKVETIDDGIYIVDNKHTSFALYSDKFAIDIIEKLKPTNIINSNPIYCSIDPYEWKSSDKFVVIPIGKFDVVQSSIIKDLIELTNIGMIDKLKSIDKPYLAKAIEIAIKDFIHVKSNTFDIIYDYLKKDRENILSCFVDTIFLTYSSLIVNPPYHKKEALLFCEKYLLVSENLLKSENHILSYNYFLDKKVVSHV